MAGHAIAYVFAIGQVMRWTTETGAPTPAWPGQRSSSSRADVACEFDLLAAGVLDTDRGVTSQPIKIPHSRSIPVHTQT